MKYYVFVPAYNISLQAGCNIAIQKTTPYKYIVPKRKITATAIFRVHSSSFYSCNLFQKYYHVFFNSCTTQSASYILNHFQCISV